MLTAVRQLAAADFIGLVTWLGDDVIELTESDPWLLPTQALRAPLAWFDGPAGAVLETNIPRRMLPSAILLALPQPPAAVCVVHSPVSGDGARGQSLVLVWLAGSVVPLTIRSDPGFLQHLLVGRAPKSRSSLPVEAVRLDVIMAHVPQGIVFVDETRSEAVVNTAAGQLLNVPAGRTTRLELGDAMQQLFARVRNQEFVRQEVARIATDPEARISDWSWELEGLNGAESVTLRVMSVPLAGEVGRGRLWTFDDVSRERALLRQLSRARVFEEKLRQVQKLELVGRLAASVAHDFNNLLTIIGGSAEMLQDAPLDADRRADLRNIEHATDRARRLTRQLLTFTRQQVEQSVSYALDVRLRETSSLLNRVLAPSGSLELELGAEGAHVYADPSQIELALLNLLANARDAMPEGGAVRLTTHIEQLTAERVNGSPNPLSGSHVAITVHDTGAGIDETTLQHMFEPFFTTKPAGQGTGLGLATVLAIAQRAGGGVRCESRAGTGTAFTILLPRANSPESVAPTSGTIGSQTASPPQEFVLLVDDDPGPRDTLRRLLAHDGFHVEVADSGAAALQILDARGDGALALVTDYMMPHMSGRELLVRVRERWPALPAIVISGFAADDVTTDFLVRMHAAFLAKPFSGRELSAAIRSQMADSTAPGMLAGQRENPG